MDVGEATMNVLERIYCRTMAEPDLMHFHIRKVL